MPRLRLRIPRNPPPMPTRIPAILRTRQRKVGPAGENIEPGMPRLWNAKRRIKRSKGLTPLQLTEFMKHPTTSTAWRTQVSPDVVAFIDANPSLPTIDKVDLLKSPSRYFTHSHTVPLSQRPQISFPTFSITFMRTPHNSPYFASFKVPRWFSKLDLKDYLLSLYNTPVVHIRSYVIPTRVKKHENHKGQPKKSYLPPSQKKMTAQLVEPFIWPAEVTDFEEWEKEEYWRVGKAQVEMQRAEGQWGKVNPNRQHRRSVQEQAREVLEGKKVWKPTWMQLPAEKRVLEGLADIVPIKKALPQVETRQPLRRIPMRKEERVPIEAPVKEFEELRV